MVPDGDDARTTDGGVAVGGIDDADLDGAPGLAPSLRRSPALLVLLVGLSLVAGLFAYDRWILVGAPTYGEWDASAMDWLTMVAAVGAVAAVLVPAITRRDRTRELWSRYPKTPTSLTALAFVAAFVLTGTVAPVFVAEPEFEVMAIQQPPAFMSIATKFAPSCVGEVAGGHCHGTMQYPLGTTRGGENVLDWTLYGARVTLQFALVTVAIMTPIAVAVGTTAGYVGGRVDDALMGYVDLQSAVPAVVVYFLVIAVTTPTLFSLVLVFGLFSWEELARSVRAAVISEKEEGYVLAARNAGAGPFTIVRRHLLPNVSGTVLTGVTNAVPKLVMIEALFAFIGLAGPKSYSWGRLIYRGLQSNETQQDLPMGFGAPIFFESAYWIILSGALAIAVTVLALTVFGDALQRAVDPTDGGG